MFRPLYWPSSGCSTYQVVLKCVIPVVRVNYSFYQVVNKHNCCVRIYVIFY